MSNETNLSRIGQIGVTVRDLEKSVAFYRDLLGMKLMLEVPGMAFFELDGLRLMLGTASGEGEAYGASILYFRVHDIQATYVALKARGVNFEREPQKVTTEDIGELWMAFFRDVENNLLALMAYQ